MAKTPVRMARKVELEGCLNFRDLGGYPAADGRSVRWRMLFRADGLQHLTPNDIDYLREEIALGDIIDLRSSGELQLDGRGLLERETIRFHHLPLFDAGVKTGMRPPTAQSTLADLYLGMAEHASEPIASVLTTLADTDDAAVYHCAAGKDRTGVLSAIILGLLGVPDDVIVIDYAATRDSLDAIVERLNASEGYQRVWERLPPDTLHADPETMIRLLRGIGERYGDMEGYARKAGVSAPSIERLRERLLE